MGHTAHADRLDTARRLCLARVRARIAGARWSGPDTNEYRDACTHVGAIGSLTLGMMTRTARGHTGRALQASRTDLFCYITIQFSAATRVLVPLAFPSLQLQAIIASGLLWSAAFGAFTIAYWPVLSQARLDGRPG